MRPFKADDRVCLHGLVGRPELNGARGYVLGYRSDKERFVVQLDRTMEDLSLKSANLKPETLRRPPLACTPEFKALAEQIKVNNTMSAEKRSLLTTKFVSLGAEAGDSESMVIISDILGSGIEEEDWSQATQERWRESYAWATKAANLGHHRSQCKVADMLERGLGCVSNPTLAIAYARKAAAAGSCKACTSMGQFYDQGIGCRQSFELAAKWYAKAVELGPDADGAYNLGVSYHAGQGVSQDNRLAFKHYKIAADLGDINAMANLGISYMLGEGKRAPQQHHSMHSLCQVLMHSLFSLQDAL